MGKFEITNAQYKVFDPGHDSGVISVFNKDHAWRGKAVNGASQPVCRIPWTRAVAFCEWLTEKTGKEFSLPTEAQWEYACRAGTATALSYGSVATDFGRLANLADSTVNQLTIRDSPKWIPCIGTVKDGACVTTNVGRYAANAWGLHDMHGNVAEWTASRYQAYPYTEDVARNDPKAQGKRVVRGGSYYDRPKRARSGFRLAYRSWQPVHNVGFRVVCEAGAAPKVAQAGQTR
jgi:formylglycine-generating enzyme required for sulfatase activity